MITCILKHATEPDLILPVSSVSTRWINTPDVSSINVTIPRGVYYSDDINVRINGWLEVYEDGVKFGYSDSISNLVFHHGSSSSSIQLTGQGTFTAGNYADINLDGVSYIVSSNNGETRFRAKFNPNIKPTGTVIYNSTSYTVKSITTTLSQTRTMEVTCV